MNAELLVTDGVKAGRRAALSSHEPVVVGTSYNCDIVLLDPASGHDESGPLHQSELSLREGQWQIRVLAGSASIADVDLLRDDVAELEPEMPISLGSSVFVITAATQSTLETTAPPKAETPATGKRRGLATATCIIAGACFLFAGASIYQRAGSGIEEMHTERPGIAALLEQQGFGGLDIKPLDDGSYRLEGVLQARADHIELKSLLASSGFETIIDVKVAEVLAERALSVYLLHDVAAEVKLSGPAQITTVSAEPDTRLLDEIESKVKLDVPEIHEIVRQNTPPEVATVAANPVAVELPGKRIMMVASSEPAYILTEDGARYYKGAMLPSGYKIVSIFDKTVKLERNDEVVELVF